jgi:hypothetical protein
LASYGIHTHAAVRSLDQRHLLEGDNDPQEPEFRAKLMAKLWFDLRINIKKYKLKYALAMHQHYCLYRVMQFPDFRA